MEDLYILPVLLFSVVVHELAHGWVALRLGDPTARDAGRLTFNPIPHIDPIGSVLIPLLSFISAHTVFIAWAKPVPVNPYNFRNFRRDDILVSVAGPVSNLVMAFVCTVLFIVSLHIVGNLENIESPFVLFVVKLLVQMFYGGITLNIFLAVFNLIPVPPLDGSHVLASLLPEEMGERYRSIGFFGIFVILLLMRIPVFYDAMLRIVMLVHIPYQFLMSVLS